MTTAQKAFESAIKKIEKKYRLTDRELCRNYHDDQSVSVDGELHAILNNMSDFLGEARSIIDEALNAKGFFMENQNGCDFKFYKI